MTEDNCPNIDVCKLVNNIGLLNNEKLRLEYFNIYCNKGEQMWSICTRYVVNNALKFCPDFVLPDTKMTPDQVIDKFDNDTDFQ